MGGILYMTLLLQTFLGTMPLFHLQTDKFWKGNIFTVSIFASRKVNIISEEKAQAVPEND